MPCVNPKALTSLTKEVWFEIFKYFHPENSVGTNQPREFPVSLAQLCPISREIALEYTPHLWASLYVSWWDPKVERTIPKLLPRQEMIDSWLVRSQNEPLMLAIEIDFLENQKDRESGNLLLRTWILEMPRWRKVELNLDREDARLAAFHQALTSKGAPLQSLDFHSPRKGEDQLRIWSTTARFFYFDFRRENKYNHTPIMIDWAATLHVPSWQFTALNFSLDTTHTTISAEEVLHILKFSPNLVSCQFYGINNTVLRPTRDVLVVPALRSLVLQVSHTIFFAPGKSGFRLAQILRCITAPALTSLAINYDANWSQKIFASFINRSSCELEELQFNYTPILPDGLSACLQRNRSLRWLVWTICPPATNYQHPWTKVLDDLQSWDHKKSEFTYCPRLEEITTNYDIFPDTEKTCFVETIKRRCCPPHPGIGHLKMLRLYHDTIPNTGDFNICCLKALSRPPINLKVDLHGCVDDYKVDKPDSIPLESGVDLINWDACED